MFGRKTKGKEPLHGVDGGLRDGGAGGAEWVDQLAVRTKAKLTGEAMRTVSEFTLRAGEERTFTLTYGSARREKHAQPVWG